MKKKVLITGSSGFLGRYLIKFAPSQVDCLIAQFRTKPPRSYGRKVQYLPLDFLDKNWDELKKLHPHVVIHTAALASIDECEIQPELSWQVNVEVTRRLVDLANQWQARFIFLSSDVVFDGEKGNYLESDIPNPQNKYAEAKVEAEKYILNNHEDAVVVRPGIFYGLALNGRPSFTETILKNLHAGKQVYLFTDQFRSPILVNNLAVALWELAQLDFRGIINVAGPQRVSRIQMGELLCNMFKFDKSLLIPIRSDEANLIARRPLDCSLDISLAQKILKTTFVDCRTGFSIAYQ